MRELMDRVDGIRLVRVDDAVGPELLGQREALGEMSTAMMRAPIAAPRSVALSPTGPCPKTASVSRPETSSRLSAP